MRGTTKFNILATILIYISYSSSYAVTLGTASNNVFGGTLIVAKLLWAACIIVGIILLMNAYMQYQQHKVNPKVVPLTMPIVLLILGLLVICIPFLGRITGIADSYSSSDPDGGEYSSYIDIDS